MFHEPRRRWILALVFLIAICAGMWALDGIARWQFTAHLRDQAAHALAFAATGGTPYRWHFGSSADLVAGRVFEADQYRFDPEGLIVESPGHAFEVGLPLNRTVDLLLFPDLHVQFDADAAGEMQIAAREDLDGPQFATTAEPITPGRNDLIFALHAIKSSLPSQTEITRAAMLRLRFSVPAGGGIHLRLATLDRAAGATHLNLEQAIEITEPGQRSTQARDVLQVYRLPLHIQIHNEAIAFISAVRDARSTPLILLPQHGRVEQQIMFRNTVYAALPSAILIPENASTESVAQARALVANPQGSASHAPLRWRLVALYAAILLYLRLWPPNRPRIRALAEIALTMAGPCWLIVGGNFDGGLQHSQIAVIVLAIVYAVSLSVPRVWRWNGSRESWIFAAGIVALSIVCGLLLHETGAESAAPGAKQILRYFGWALLQQYLICAVCTERWRLVTGKTLPAVYLGALGFALLHSPNAALMLATFVGGLCWCALYLRERALLPLAVSHALSALVLLTLLPREILHSAEVSARFFL